MPDNDRLYQMLERLDIKVDAISVQMERIKTTQEHQQVEIDTIKTDIQSLRESFATDGKKVFLLWFVGAACVVAAINWGFRWLPIR